MPAITNKRMDYKTFVNKLARRMDTDADTASGLTAALASVLRERACNLDSIAIPGFGNFVAVKQAEKVIVDEHAGKRLLLPPNIRIEFVASAMLKKQIIPQQ